MGTSSMWTTFVFSPWYFYTITLEVKYTPEPYTVPFRGHAPSAVGRLLCINLAHALNYRQTRVTMKTF